MGKPAKNFKEVLCLLLSGVAAGASIGLGGWGFASVRTMDVFGLFLGSLTFSLGIILVCVFGLMLYTGKIGYLFRPWLFSQGGEPASLRWRSICLLIIFIGNVIGAFLMGRLANWLSPVATAQSLSSIVSAKNDSGAVEMFVRSILCGALVYAGVDLYKKYQGVLGTFLVAICIAAFVLLGFDHCIANAFYWGADASNAGWLFPLKGVLLCAVGNSIGALVLDQGKAIFGK